MVVSIKQVGKKIIDYPDDPVPTVGISDWVKEDLAVEPKSFVIHYVRRLFPILGWITRYNFGWFVGDLIAGITVGLVLVPQSMGYALIATLPAQYGLYSAFVGTFVYCLFATSRDVSIGPVAVMSLIMSKVIAYVTDRHGDKWADTQIATTVSFICGFIVLGAGLLRIGRIVDLIPAPAVSAFMTGSALNILVGQVPGLMGITGFSTRAATYEVMINTLKGLPRTKVDAAFGLVGLAFLYFVRFTCEYLSKRYPRRARVFFFISVLRSGFAVIILTIASWLYCRHKKTAPIKILSTVPSGFRDVGAPTIDPELITALAPELPVATIVLLLEHIAISRSFGRVNNYKIDPNQELIAIGVTNTVGSCFGAYPATGSFSRSALKAKSGVRTPLAGIFSSLCVIVALYGLTPAFYWIPTAGLAAVVIHAVADLIAKPPQVYSLWRVAPLECIIWWAGVLVSVFSSIENGIYTTICVSMALLLFRIAQPRGYFLGRVELERATPAAEKGDKVGEAREIFVPMEKNGVVNPHIKVTPPAPGVIVYRFEESYLYPNSAVMNEYLVDYAKEHTKMGKDMSGVKKSDRAWNDPEPSNHADLVEAERRKPILHAIVLDFSTVSHIDTTSVQALIDARNELERYTDRPVEFHFASILSPWISRALIAGGFGTGLPASHGPREIAPVVGYRDRDFYNTQRPELAASNDVEAAVGGVQKRSSSRKTQHGFEEAEEGKATLLPVETPFFHFDLSSAVKAAELGLRKSAESVDARSRTSSSGGRSDDDVKEAEVAEV